MMRNRTVSYSTPTVALGLRADASCSAKRKEVIGVVLYPTLCSTFFSISISHMSVDLRCTVSLNYNMKVRILQF